MRSEALAEKGFLVHYVYLLQSKADLAPLYPTAGGEIIDCQAVE
jgi:hypothetical protein